MMQSDSHALQKVLAIPLPLQTVQQQLSASEMPYDIILTGTKLLVSKCYAGWCNLYKLHLLHAWKLHPEKKNPWP